MKHGLKGELTPDRCLKDTKVPHFGYC